MLPVCFQMICQKLCQLFEFLTKYLKLLCWHIGNEAQTRLRCRTCRRCHGRGTATQKQPEKWWGLGSQKVVVYMCLRCKYDREVVLFVNGFTALWTTSLFYELHSKGKLWDIYIYLILLIPSKPPPLSSSFDPKGSGKRFFGKIAAAR